MMRTSEKEVVRVGTLILFGIGLAVSLGCLVAFLVERLRHGRSMRKGYGITFGFGIVLTPIFLIALFLTIACQVHDVRWLPYEAQYLEASIQKTESLLADYNKQLSIGQGLAIAGEGNELKKELVGLYEKKSNVWARINYLESEQSPWMLYGIDQNMISALKNNQPFSASGARSGMALIRWMIFLFLGGILLMVIGGIVEKFICFDYGDCALAAYVMGAILIFVSILMVIVAPLAELSDARSIPYNINSTENTILATEKLLVDYKTAMETGQGIAAAGEGRQVRQKLSQLYQVLYYYRAQADSINSGRSQAMLYNIKLLPTSL